MGPVLYQGKYDLNIKRITMVLDPDKNERYPCEEYDVLMAIHDNRLSVATHEPSGMIRDVRDSRVNEDNRVWDVHITDISDDSGGAVYSEIHGETELGKDFVKRYLASVLIQYECRNCNTTLVGDEAFRNLCLCEECERAFPNYFSD